MKYSLLLISLFLVSCSEPRAEMNELEQYLAAKYNAEYVSANIKNTEKKTNGTLTSKTVFLHIELEEPEYLVGIRHNQLLFKEECEQFANYLMDSVQWQSVDFNEIQIDVIEELCFTVFNKKETSTYTVELIKRE